MKLTSFGAAGGVTGSKHLLEFENGQKLLLDCGLFQGRRQESEIKNRAFPAEVLKADAVILSHAHIDHSGSLPSLIKNGFANPIYATPATRDLCEIMLADSAHIHEQDAKYLAEKVWPKPKPLYTQEDVDATMPLFQTKKYGEVFEPVAGVKVRFVDAGHILGSAEVEIEFTENGVPRRLGFTGDLGRKRLPILRDPTQMQNLDILITESTYADRLHDDIQKVSELMLEIVTKTAKRGGKIIIPAFSVERTQEIIYVLHDLHASGKLKFELPIFVDSPLAVNATDIFKKHRECWDAATYADFIEKGKGPFTMQSLEYVRDVERSKELNSINYPVIIISASGMCEAGRIRHHLRNNISDPKNTVLIVGFQAENTLGRRLVEKRPEVKIFGQPVARRCEVDILNAFSAHADRDELFANIQNSGASKVICVHGEKNSVEFLADRARKELNIEAVVPEEGIMFEV
ncbi:MAG: MBL fold metallo-hydrolase [Patescibacteria group bacterium]